MSNPSRTRLRPSAARPVSQRHDATEREAERAADVVARGGFVASWSFSNVAASSPVQRQEVLVEKSDEEKKKEAIDTTKKAVLETPQVKALEAKVLADPLVKTVKAAVTSTPGLVVTGAAAAGGVAALAATGKELPIQPPAIPLDKITPGLSAKITYQGPVNAPTFVGLTLTYDEQGPKAKGGKAAADDPRAREAAAAAAFQRTITYAPGSKEAEEQRLTEDAIARYVARTSGLPGLTIPLTPPPKKDDEKKTPVQPAPASPSAAPPRHAHVDDALAAPGRPLDPPTRTAMETRFGYDFSAVRVHDDARAAAAAAAIDAAAFTVGADIVFATGRNDPASPSGRRLLAHELAHVVQGDPGDGRVRRDAPTTTTQTAPAPTALTDQDVRTYLETIRRTRAIVGGAAGPRKALEVITRWRAHSPDYAILTIPERAILIRELLAGSATATTETAILDLFTEALPEERLGLMWAVGEEQVRAGLGEPNRRVFDNLVRASVDTAVEALVTNWTVPEVVRILDRLGDAHVIDDLLARGYRIMRFDTAFDRWRYDDGHTEEVELTGLRGNTDRDARIIRLRASLSAEEAATALFHEIRHAVSPQTTTDDEYLEDEISARVRTEEFRIRHGMGPTRESYRRPDGTVDEDAIRREIRASPHYNPTGRTRIGRRYVGQAAVGGWRPPPQRTGARP